MTQPRVAQLARRGFLPYERTPDWRRVFRLVRLIFQLLGEAGLAVAEAEADPEHQGRGSGAPSMA